jgi:radical SAM protein with 4Fe4S-binding SPASM domain
VFNLFKLFLTYHLSRIKGKVHHSALPFAVSIEPTTSCNLRCPQCPSGLREFTRPTGMLSNGLFEKTVRELKTSVHSLTFYFQGEPYLNPGFLKMVSHASSNKLFTITSTNAHYLNEENCINTVKSGLHKLIISVDGVTQDSYEAYRIGGQLEKVIAGTKEMIRQKKLLRSKTPHIVWQFVVFKNNEHEVDEVKRMGRELGVDEVKIKTAQIYDLKNAQDLVPETESYSRYRKNGEGHYEIKNELLNQCWRMWQGCVVTWDGKIVPCCFDKDARYRLGDLGSQSFNEIWFSGEYSRFRASILKGRKQIDICNNCTEGTRVWA